MEHRHIPACIPTTYEIQRGREGQNQYITSLSLGKLVYRLDFLHNVVLGRLRDLFFRFLFLPPGFFPSLWGGMGLRIPERPGLPGVIEMVGSSRNSDVRQLDYIDERMNERMDHINH